MKYRYYYKDHFDHRQNRVVISLDQLSQLTGKSVGVLKNIFDLTKSFNLPERYYIEKVKYIGEDIGEV